MELKKRKKEKKIGIENAKWFRENQKLPPFSLITAHMTPSCCACIISLGGGFMACTTANFYHHRRHKQKYVFVQSKVFRNWPAFPRPDELREWKRTAPFLTTTTTNLLYISFSLSFFFGTFFRFADATTYTTTITVVACCCCWWWSCCCCSAASKARYVTFLFHQAVSFSFL